MLRRLPAWALFVCLLGLLVLNGAVYRGVARPPDALAIELLPQRSVLLRPPSGETILIDAGRDASILRALGEALPLWEREVGTLVLTRERSLGLSALLERYTIGRVVHTSEYMLGEPLSLARGVTASILWRDPLILRLAYNTQTLLISSSTPPGTYLLK